MTKHCLQFFAVLSKRNQTLLKTLNEFDKTPEEKKRRATINSYSVEFFTDKKHFAHTDGPGHFNYIKVSREYLYWFLLEF